MGHRQMVQYLYTRVLRGIPFYLGDPKKNAVGAFKLSIIERRPLFFIKMQQHQIKRNTSFNLRITSTLTMLYDWILKRVLSNCLHCENESHTEKRKKLALVLRFSHRPATQKKKNKKTKKYVNGERKNVGMSSQLGSTVDSPKKTIYLLSGLCVCVWLCLYRLAVVAYSTYLRSVETWFRFRLFFGCCFVVVFVVVALNVQTLR